MIRKNYFLKSLIYVVVPLTFLSCSREVQQTGEVYFQMPSSFSQAMRSTAIQKNEAFVSNLIWASNLDSVSLMALEEKDWMAVDVVQQGTTEPNCFFVVASGPELDQFACYKSTDTATPFVIYGEMEGPAFLSEPLSMKVLSGRNRVFKVFGMYALTPLDCKNINDSEFNRAALSKPYLVGYSEPTEIVAGKLTTVEIALNYFNKADYVDFCTDNGTGLITRPPPQSVPTVLHVDINFGFLRGTTAYEGCTQLDISVLDQTETKVIPSLIQDNLTIKLGVSALQTHASSRECEQNINAVTSFNTKDNAVTTRWYRSPMSLPTYSISVSGTDGANYLNTQMGNLLVRVDGNNTNKAATLRAAKSVMPDAIVPEMCNPIIFSTGAVSGTTSLMNSNYIDSGQRVDITAAVSGTGAITTFYNDSACSVSPTSTVVQPGNGGAGTILYQRYFKVTGTSNTQLVEFNFNHQTGTPSPLTMGHRRVSLFGNQSTTPTRFKIHGYNISTSSSSGRCLGPYMITMANEDGSTVEPLADENFKFSYDASKGTTIRSANSLNAAPCSEAPISSGTTLTLNKSDGRYLFWVEVAPINVTNPGWDTRFIRVYDSDLLATTTYTPIKDDDITIILEEPTATDLYTPPENDQCGRVDRQGNPFPGYVCP